jgi:hypothetical protein
MNQLTKQELLRRGITREQARAALEFYKNEMQRNCGNKTAAERVKLMEQIIRLLET